MFNITVENQVFFLVEYKNILFVRSLKVFPWKSFTFGLIYNLNMFFYSVFSPIHSDFLQSELQVIVMFL